MYISEKTNIGNIGKLLRSIIQTNHPVEEHAAEINQTRWLCGTEGNIASPMMQKCCQVCREGVKFLF